MKTITLGLLTLALASASGASPNLLTNPGFETGDLSGWTVAGKNGGFGVSSDGVQLPVTSAVAGLPDFFYASWQNVRSGSYAAYGITAGDSQAAFREYVSFSQNLVLPAGSYQLGFYMGTDNEIGGFGISSALSDHRLGIFLDGNYLPLLTQPPVNFIGGSRPTDFFEFVS
ncbi:MAG TPA: hypothetical protein VLT36_19670, partial [Candidatus Dormibacteraeota bacterium]|nr:hypothetical protein [Candidatus Dormibacteraeota bacterium]